MSAQYMTAFSALRAVGLMLPLLITSSLGAAALGAVAADPEEDASCSSPQAAPRQRSLLQSRVEAGAVVPVAAEPWGAEVMGDLDDPEQDLSLLAAAPSPGKVKAAVKGDLHFTVRQCHCLLEWEYKGKTYKSCNKVPTDFSHGWAWCVVEDDCEKPEGLLDEGGQKWDFCPMPGEVAHRETVHGCHCTTQWYYENEQGEKLYSNCARTSKGRPWCFVWETDDLCPEALRTEHGGQHWDYCWRPRDTKPYLTRLGCHCMPEWELNGKQYAGCSRVEGKELPGCIVLEDHQACPGATVIPGSNLLYDECLVPKDEQDSVLDALVSPNNADSCHCRASWTYGGKQYQNCASTPDEEKRWCYVVEDRRTCKDSFEDVDASNPLVQHSNEPEDAAMPGRRWMYCEEEPAPEPEPHHEAPVTPPQVVVSPAPAPKPDALHVNVIPVIVPVKNWH